MTMIEKISTKLENKGVKLEGALYIDCVKPNSDDAKIYDMSYSTFSKKLIGYWFADTEKLTIL